MFYRWTSIVSANHSSCAVVRLNLAQYVAEGSCCLIEIDVCEISLKQVEKLVDNLYVTLISKLRFHQKFCCSNDFFSSKLKYVRAFKYWIKARKINVSTVVLVNSYFLEIFRAIQRYSVWRLNIRYIEFDIGVFIIEYLKIFNKKLFRPIHTYSENQSDIELSIFIQASP